MARPLKGRRRKAVQAPTSFVPEYKPPSPRERMKQGVEMHTDSMARDILGEHPLLKGLKPKIAKAVMDIARKHAVLKRV